MNETINDNPLFKKPVTEKEREQYAKMYTPLVHKIVSQNQNKSPLSHDDLIGFGFEGLADAMNTYNPSKGQTFLQYASYRIYYFITNGSYQEGHIVKFSDYQQKKAKAAGKSTWIYQPIISKEQPDGSERWNIPEPAVEPEKTSVGKALDDIRAFVVSRFSKRDADIFFQTFGLGEKDDVPRVKIAKQYKVSSAAITYVNQRIIKAIKEDDALREELEDLL